MNERQAIEKSPPRLESVEKVIGRARYTDDLDVPGMVYGRIARSPYAHAKVVRFDKSEALKVPGVLGVLGPEDTPDVRYNCSGNPPGGLIVKDERILTDHPLYAGDRVAAVCAETPKACALALEKLVIEYEPLEAVFDVKEAIAFGAPLVHPEMFESNIYKTIRAKVGDVEEGFTQSDFVFEEEYYTPAVQHTALEPVGCVCYCMPDGNVTVWANTQAPFQDRRILAELMELPESAVRIVKPMMGGGFGGRQQVHNQPVGLFLSKLVNRPVKIINTREEEMYASTTRHACLIRLKAGVSKDGRFTAFHSKVYLNTGAYSTHGPIVAGAQTKKFHYRVPHYLYEGHCVYTNAPVAGAMRGYGNPQLTFARELMIDKIAKALHMDPLEFRLKNQLEVGEPIPAHSFALRSCGIKECVEAGEKIRAEIDDKEKGEHKKDDSRIKEAWGVAFGCHTSGPSNNEGLSSCLIIINDDGTVQLKLGAADMGQGSDTTLSQVAAEALSIDLKDITLIATDTMNTPYDSGSFASSQIYISGNAVHLAALDARERLMKALAARYETDPDKVRYDEGTYTVLKPDGERLDFTFKEAVRAVSFGMFGTVLMGSAYFKASESPPPFAVCWAKVAVDTVRKTLTVKHLIQTVDVGTPINPQIVIGQVEGGLGMGFGFAVMEEIEIDKRANKPSSSDLLHYKVPMAPDMPQLHADIVKGYEPTGAFGAKSVGELPAVPTAAAVACAVANATGEEITKLPLSHWYLPRIVRTTGE